MFSRRLRRSLFGLIARVFGLAGASWLTTGDSLVHATYLSLLDLFAIDDPAMGEPMNRQIIQLLSWHVLRGRRRPGSSPRSGQVGTEHGIKGA
ncbi:hypothetical protein ACFU53_26810 [Streptomyces sp. NPDC057474]|uniref:hypothetical protein n=1 Tax=Streptomyces sp. NPDC057474 TaxID=3346144 RepID=UPI0036BFF2D0